MKKKILLVSGCSWTTNNFKSIHHNKPFDFTKWPSILADKLNMECCNLAKSGAGNEYILNSLIEKIEILKPENIGLVIAAWSGGAREDYQVRAKYPNLDLWHHERWSVKGDMHYFMKRSLRQYYLFQIYCEKYNIPYKQVQMIDLWQAGIWDDFSSEMMFKSNVDKYDAHYTFANSVLYRKINTNNFIGWPGIGLSRYVKSYNKPADRFLRNGFNFRELIHKNKLEISDIDKHPNEKGHKLIAEKIYENL